MCEELVPIRLQCEKCVPIPLTSEQLVPISVTFHLHVTKWYQIFTHVKNLDKLSAFTKYDLRVKNWNRMQNAAALGCTCIYRCEKYARGV